MPRSQLCIAVQVWTYQDLPLEQFKTVTRTLLGGGHCYYIIRLEAIATRSKDATSSSWP